MPLQEELEKQGNFLFKYRGSIPVLILILALSVFIYERRVSDFIIMQSSYAYFCFAISFFGLLIRIYTVGYTPKNTSGRNTQVQIADEINKTGIYSTVRHPLYVGNFFMWLGAALLTENVFFILFFVAFYWLYYERIMFAEEQFLRKKFGGKYLEWAEKTPAFIPEFAHFIKPAYNFSVKKIVRKEVNGLMNMFIVFTLFDITEYFIRSNTFGIENKFWVIGFFISLVCYVVLKIVSKRTSLLEDDGRV